MGGFVKEGLGRAEAVLAGGFAVWPPPSEAVLGASYRLYSPRIFNICTTLPSPRQPSQSYRTLRKLRSQKGSRHRRHHPIINPYQYELANPEAYSPKNAAKGFPRGQPTIQHQQRASKPNWTPHPYILPVLTHVLFTNVLLTHVLLLRDARPLRSAIFPWRPPLRPE